MSLACKCDVCGMIISLKTGDKHVNEVMLGTYNYGNSNYNVEQFFDVCDNCYEKILGQMKETKKSDTVYHTADTV